MACRLCVLRRFRAQCADKRLQGKSPEWSDEDRLFLPIMVAPVTPLFHTSPSRHLWGCLVCILTITLLNATSTLSYPCGCSLWTQVYARPAEHLFNTVTRARSCAWKHSEHSGFYMDAQHRTYSCIYYAFLHSWFCKYIFFIYWRRRAICFKMKLIQCILLQDSTNHF